VDRLLANVKNNELTNLLYVFAAILASALALAGCPTVKPYDYTNFRAHRRARSWSCRQTEREQPLSKAPTAPDDSDAGPVAERRLLLFPVAVVDQFMKENGLSHCQ